MSRNARFRATALLGLALLGAAPGLVAGDADADLAAGIARIEAGDFDAALALLHPLAVPEQAPPVRLRAAAALLEIQATTQDLVAGHARLEAMQAEAEALGDADLQRLVDLAAAGYYNAVAQYDVALRHARRVLEGGPTEAERCLAGLAALAARVATPGMSPETGAFEEAGGGCRRAGQQRAAERVELLRSQHLRERGLASEAAARLAAHLPAILALGDSILAADAHATQAENLLRTGEIDGAGRHAEEAIRRSVHLPSGRTLLAARRVRYEVALARGNTPGALRELQALITAEHAFAAEKHAAQSAYFTGRHEAVQREIASALLEEEGKQAAAEQAKADSDALRNRLLLLPAVLGLAGVAAFAMIKRRRRERFRHLTQHDPLTGLWARSHFTEVASGALARSQRDSRPMALVLFDLDHFSRINARWGHLSGDRVLVAVAQALVPLEQPPLRFGRMGGEEFAFLLPQAGLEEGLAFAERCREAIAGARLEAYGSEEPITVTASFGVVSTATVGYRLRDLLANADAALYRAKSAGRNRVAAAVVAPVQEPDPA
jgi:diguanylate cyclase (GGDEF)-like protein